MAPTPQRGTAAYQHLLTRLATAYYTSRGTAKDTDGPEMLQIVTRTYGPDGVFDLCAILTLTANQMAAPHLRDATGRIDLDLLLETPGHPDEEAAALSARAGKKLTSEGRDMVTNLGRFRPVLQNALNLTGTPQTLYHAIRDTLTAPGRTPAHASVCATLVLTTIEAIGRIEASRSTS